MRWRHPVGSALLLAVAAATACSPGGGSPAAGPSPAASPTPSAAPVTTAPASPPPTLPADAAGTSCPEFAARGRQVRFPDGAHVEVAGIVLGGGRTGVVLGHQSNGTVCQWLPYGLTLARRGYRVLAIDFAGHGASGPLPAGMTEPLAADVAAATGYLRRTGTPQVVLIGGSMGGTGVVAAAAAIRPPVAGVVCLSGPQDYAGTDALAAARRLAVPTLYAVGRDDSSFVDDVRALYAATPEAAGARLVEADTGLHGVSLVGEAGDATVDAAVDAFLAAHAPPR